ncbi:uncharacterized protein BCR38DRAFT_521101 [Pseudomassariella vexata]|uniref:Uncharacterized protein n=1 Tax=Pseudomassariella vexata TaxID=1141098 RepID=A0A1Y2EFD9_9PEZI|nr:uncharacterized protein BCR38DRAFT_521101 [Pseudomassariella vexata]ORY70291.1 hypothetical protein BCR38DRAFT_521101 [Pseudomassariella vexata]
MRSVFLLAAWVATAQAASLPIVPSKQIHARNPNIATIDKTKRGTVFVGPATSYETDKRSDSFFLEEVDNRDVFTTPELSDEIDRRAVSTTPESGYKEIDRRVFFTVPASDDGEIARRLVFAAHDSGSDEIDRRVVFTAPGSGDDEIDRRSDRVIFTEPVTADDTTGVHKRLYFAIPSSSSGAVEEADPDTAVPPRAAVSKK